METIIDNEVLQGVGKKVRNGYLAKTVSASKVMECYRRNRKEADAFSCFAWTVFDMMMYEKETHNPIIKKKLQQAIEAYNTKQVKSNDQNRLSLDKLMRFKTDALGIGLRKVLSQMRRLVKHSGEINARIALLLLETEFANLTAKKLHDLKGVIYERKTILLERVSYLLEEAGWKYGISQKTGKNASYVIYIYLPNGVQLSWHCNEYQMLYYYPEIDCEWDGQACMTMEKILTYISETYHIGEEGTSVIAA